MKVSFEGSSSHGKKGPSLAKITRKVGKGSSYTIPSPFDTTDLLRISTCSKSVGDSLKAFSGSLKAFSGFTKVVASKLDLFEFEAQERISLLFSALDI